MLQSSARDLSGLFQPPASPHSLIYDSAQLLLFQSSWASGSVREWLLNPVALRLKIRYSEPGPTAPYYRLQGPPASQPAEI